MLSRPGGRGKQKEAAFPGRAEIGHKFSVQPEGSARHSGE